MKKALFLFFEGLPLTVIDSQVLIHCKNMKKIGVEFEIWSFACNEELYQSSLKRVEYAKELSDCEVKVFKGLRPAFPFSERINASLVKRYLQEYNKVFSIIHARTNYSSHVASLVTNDFIWDCRGDSVAEFEKAYQYSSNIAGKIYKRYKMKKNIQKAKLSKKAIFVSSFLQQKYSYDKENYILGCSASSDLFYCDKDIRDETRRELEYSEDDKILIYSGGMAHYQMFKESIDVFISLDNSWKLLILTTDTDSAKQYLGNIDKDRVILKSVKFEDVNQYLNAADVGIMLREKDDLNRAASPTKYAEYSMSGLPIIYSDNIGDLELYNNTIKNRISLYNINKVDINTRKIIADKASSILDKKSFLSTYKKVYDV